MSQTCQQATAIRVTGNLGATLRQYLSHLFTPLQEARQRRMTSAAVEAMSQAQRQDLGVGAPNRPTIEVPAGLMTTLMSLR